MENRLAYLLIVEINDYIILVKKNISRISSFINSLTSIPTDTLAGVLVDDDTVFQQMKLSNMNMNENAMRNKSYEANSLALIIQLLIQHDLPILMAYVL